MRGEKDKNYGSRDPSNKHPKKTLNGLKGRKKASSVKIDFTSGVEDNETQWETKSLKKTKQGGREGKEAKNLPPDFIKSNHNS